MAGLTVIGLAQASANPDASENILAHGHCGRRFRLHSKCTHLPYLTYRPVDKKGTNDNCLDLGNEHVICIHSTLKWSHAPLPEVIGQCFQTAIHCAIIQLQCRTVWWICSLTCNTGPLLYEMNSLCLFCFVNSLSWKLNVLNNISLPLHLVQCLVNCMHALLMVREWH